jgi:SAM-dependent methyltransferase
MVSDRMKTAYDRIAGQFAERYGSMPPFLETFTTAFLEQLPDHPTILDAGCGHGRDMEWFEEHGCSVTGIDLSPEMLALARTRTTGQLREVDLLELDFETATFDGIWSNAALLHIPKTRTADVLRQFQDILKPAGSLALGLHRGDFEGWESGTYVGTERYFSRFTEAEIESLLTACGFTITSIQTHKAPGRDWIQLIAKNAGAA